MQRRTLRGWFDYLDDPKRELTESEFMALMLFNTREYARMTLDLVRELTDATEHTEGMVGTLDELMAATDARYKALADRRARPAPAPLGRGQP